MIRSLLAVALAGSLELGAAPKNWFDVMEYGAKGDGKTSDTAAIQSALDAAGKVKGTVWFPAGEYPCHGLKVPSHVMLKGDPVWIFRTEKCGATLQLDDPKARCLLDVTGAFGVRVYGLVLSGLRWGTPKPVDGILMGNAQTSKKEDSLFIDDCKVMRFSGHGVALHRCWMYIIRHSQFMENGGCGVLADACDGFVTDNMFTANAEDGFGGEGIRGNTVMFTANRVEWNKGAGLRVASSSWNVTGNSFDRNYGGALILTNASQSAVTGNLFRRSGKDPAKMAKGETSCQVKMIGCRGVSLVGNTFRAGRDDGGKGVFTPQYGIELGHLTTCIVKDNTLFEGYMDEMYLNRGGNSADTVISDNVGTRREIHPWEREKK